MKITRKLVKRQYTHWVSFPIEFIEKLGYKAGDEIEINIKRKLDDRK